MTRVWWPGDGEDDSDLPAALQGSVTRRILIIVEVQPKTSWHGGSFYTIGPTYGDVILREYDTDGHEGRSVSIIQTQDEARAALVMLQIAAERLFPGG